MKVYHNKGLAGVLSSLESTLTRNHGGGSEILRMKPLDNIIVWYVQVPAASARHWRDLLADASRAVLSRGQFPRPSLTRVFAQVAASKALGGLHGIAPGPAGQELVWKGAC